MFWFPKSFPVFFNSVGSAFTLAASHLAHSKNKRRFPTHVEKSIIDFGRCNGPRERRFGRYSDSPLHPRSNLQSRRTLISAFPPRGAIDTLWEAVRGLHS